MKTDAELLREFVESHNENAFAELVNRHISLVYSAACRATKGDMSAAQDVTQLVFIELARKAVSLKRHPTLAGWLYASVRYVSANLQRSEQRRSAREGEAHTMNELLHTASTDPAWEELRPVLDDALHELSEHDRDAVLLRFFESKNLREVGEALCLTENAARMRVDRALEKLRKALARRGINSTSSALTATLAAGLVAAPPTLAAAVTTSALAATTVSAASTSTLFGIMTMTKLKITAVTALVVAAVSVSIWQQWRYARLARENETLRSQPEQAAQLREDNQRLAEALRAADERAQSERRELLRFRGQAAVARGLEAEKEKAVAKAEPWRQRFEAVYKLRDGEILRRAARPFIPERDEFYRREYRSSTGKTGPKNAPDYFVFRQDEQGLHEWAMGYGSGNPKLEDVLRTALGLKRYQFSGADELLALAVPGDWVVHEGASMESRLAALEPLLLDATGRNPRFEKQPVEDDVIVVRGSFAPAKEYQNIDVFAENKSEAGGGGGNFQEFLEALGDRLNVAFASEVQLQNQLPISWLWHTDSKYSRAGDRRAELVNKVLENLNQQTSLSFELQSRPAEVWFVQEKR